MPEYVADEAYHVVRLRDGRQLSYAQYGDPDGFPILNAHGGLACRLDVAGAAPAAEMCGVRLVSPDRPGVGHSDPQPGRTILDWTRDVTELLDRLDVDRFALMGWSLGGQYAAAVGYALPQRVTRAAIVAGAIPLTEPGAFDRLPAIDRNYIRMSRHAPWAAAVLPRHGAGGQTRSATLRLACRARSRNRGRRGPEGRRFHEIRQHVAGGGTAAPGRRRGIPRHGAPVGVHARGHPGAGGRMGGHG